MLWLSPPIREILTSKADRAVMAVTIGRVGEALLLLSQPFDSARLMLLCCLLKRALISDFISVAF